MESDDGSLYHLSSTHGHGGVLSPFAFLYNTVLKVNPERSTTLH